MNNEKEGTSVVETIGTFSFGLCAVVGFVVIANASWNTFDFARAATETYLIKATYEERIANLPECRSKPIEPSSWDMSEKFFTENSKFLGRGGAR